MKYLAILISSLVSLNLLAMVPTEAKSYSEYGEAGHIYRAGVEATICEGRGKRNQDYQHSQNMASGDNVMENVLQ